MNRNNLLFGVSAAAFWAALAAGSAAAQTQTGNCTAATGGTTGISPGGTCTVDNRAVGNDNSNSFIFQVGEGNEATVAQQGDDHTSIIEQTGENNDATHDQAGNDHYADTDQDGDDNVSFVVQRDQDNSATVVQEGNRNRLILGQGTTFSGDPDPAGGENNVASITMRGNNLSLLDVRQGRATFGQGPADDNEMTIVMTGTGNGGGNVHQLSRGNTLRLNVSGGGVTETGAFLGNTVGVLQNNPFYRQNAEGAFVAAFPTPANNPLSGNLVDMVVSGQRNGSFVQQNGVLNTMLVTMAGGGAGTTGDTATGTPATNPENFGPSGARLPMNRIQGNRSDISQDGRGNTAAISTGLVAQGNRSNIDQGTAGTSNLGRDHTAFVWQRGILDNSSILQDNNARGAAGAAQFASYADVSQRSLNSTSYVEQLGTNSATVSQGTGTATGDNSVRVRQQDAGDVTSGGTGGIFDDPSTDVAVGRNSVAVSQTGIGNSLTVDQDARNATAIVWQQIGSYGNGAEIEQGTGTQGTGGNTGADGAAVGSAGGYLSGSVAGASGADTLNVTADVTQSGRGSTARVRQDGQDLSFRATQAGTATDASGVAIDSGNVLLVSQVNALNSATVTQSGFGLEATVDQRGAGEIGTDDVTRRNLVTIQQTGDDHRAIARQREMVGPSGPNNTANTAAPAAGDASQPTVFTFARAAGRQSAEIQIIQSGSTNTTNASALDDTGNDAFVEQRGRGQFARIVQTGAGNDAGIRQNANATNAVAVIEQNGNGNSFFITQDTAGQYMHIRQTGNNNASTTEVSSAPTTGQTGGTGSPTNPGFFPF